jgi:RimJ/RimL family protein N-acetyltransferase
MTEAAEAVTSYAFEVLGWRQLYVSNAELNVASRKIKGKHPVNTASIRRLA